MASLVSCRCGKQYQTPDSLAGKRVKCRSCGGVFQVPPLPAPEDPLGLGNLADLEAGANPLNIPPPSSRTLPAAPAAADHYAPPSRPRPRRAARRRAAVDADSQQAIGTIAVGLLLCAVGIGVTVVSYVAAEPGGTFVVWYGLVIAGLVAIVRGVAGLFG